MFLMALSVPIALKYTDCAVLDTPFRILPCSICCLCYTLL